MVNGIGAATSWFDRLTMRSRKALFQARSRTARLAPSLIRDRVSTPSPKSVAFYGMVTALTYHRGDSGSSGRVGLTRIIQPVVLRTGTESA